MGSVVFVVLLLMIVTSTQEMDNQLSAPEQSLSHDASLLVLSSPLLLKYVTL